MGNDYNGTNNIIAPVSTENSNAMRKRAWLEGGPASGGRGAGRLM